LAHYERLEIAVLVAIGTAVVGQVEHQQLVELLCFVLKLETMLMATLGSELTSSRLVS